VKLHGGAMDVRSEADPNSPNRGTTFMLRIPVSVSGGKRARLMDPVPAGRANGTTMERKENV
jgi:hypothetical protein